MHILTAYGGLFTSVHAASINTILKKDCRWQICGKNYAAKELIARVNAGHTEIAVAQPLHQLFMKTNIPIAREEDILSCLIQIETTY